MTLPVTLTLVRHGESEGNIAVKRSKNGDHSSYTPEFLARHSSLWRLTERGKEQAEAAGAWLKKNGCRFDRCYTSDYVRAQETAGLLGQRDARWYSDIYLRERDRGDLDVCSAEEAQAKHGDSLRRRDIDPFYWCPPSGESMAHLCMRIDRFLDTLHRETSVGSALVVCHGETMWGFRVRIERMSQATYRKLDESDDKRDRIHNAQIIQYSRTNPMAARVAGPAPYYRWMRSVCPTDEKLSWNKWTEIERQTYTNEELLRNAERHPRIIHEAE